MYFVAALGIRAFVYLSLLHKLASSVHGRMIIVLCNLVAVYFVMCTPSHCVLICFLCILEQTLQYYRGDQTSPYSPGNYARSH